MIDNVIFVSSRYSRSIDTPKLTPTAIDINDVGSVNIAVPTISLDATHEPILIDNTTNLFGS